MSAAGAGHPTPVAVDLPRSYRLLNHGPTVIVSAAYGGRRNLMAAAWSMPLDFDPPKVVVVLDKSTYTRDLIEASGRFALNLPTRAMARLTMAVGSESGREMLEPDKFAVQGLQPFDGPVLGLPLVPGCAGWLECEVLREQRNESVYDLFIGQVVGALADPRVFSDGRWHFEGADDSMRTVHYIAGGRFMQIGEAFDAN